MSNDWIEGRGYRKKLLVDEQQLRCPGTLVQLIEIDPHTKVPFHYHKTPVEVFHMLEGSGRMEVGGVAHELAPGDTLTCHPPQVHNAENPTATTWRYIVFKTNVTPEDSYWLEEPRP